MTTSMTSQPVEKKVYFALKQLYQLERLREMKGPKALEDALVRQLKDSHAALGDALWEQVHKLYPAFKEEQKELEAANKAWEEKCSKCVHWTGGDEMSDKWCAKYSRHQIVKPKPCATFRLKVLN